MSKKSLVLVALVAFVVFGGMVVWLFQPMPYRASAKQQREFDLQVSYDKFRQIMVRKNATQAIVSHGGMKLIREGVEDLKVDLSSDERPVLNAILGRSKAEVDATKMLTVEINNAQVDTEQLTLRSRAQVNAEKLHVESKSVGEQGQIKNYITVISARPEGDATRVSLSLEMTIEVRLPKMLTSYADQGVETAVGEALAQQQAAITAFVIEHADKRIVLPQLN